MRGNVVKEAFLAVGCALALAGQDLFAEGVKVSERFGYDPEDSTSFLQAALDSGLPEIVVDRKETPWVVRPLFAKSNQKIVFEKGVVLLAKRGEFVGRNDWLLGICGVENVSVSGYGAVFRMWREDYAHGRDGRGKDYRRGEWRHAISIKGARKVVIEGLLIEESGGDGVVIGVGLHSAKAVVPSRDIVLRDLVCDRNHRQGLSVCGVERLLVEDCVFRNTRGTWPMDGVDLEPDRFDHPLSDILFRNCVSENNAGNGFEVAMMNGRVKSRPISIRFENCKTVGCRKSVVVVTGAKNSEDGFAGGCVEFTGCLFEGCGYSPVHVRQVPGAGIRTMFRNCRVSGFGTKDPEAAMALFEDVLTNGPKPAFPDVSGIACEDLGSRPRSVFNTRNYASMGERDYPCLPAEVQGARVRDANPGKPSPCSPNRLTGRLRFVAYADGARMVRLRVRREVNGGATGQLPSEEISVTDVGGAVVSKLKLPDIGVSAELAFAVPAAGFYALETNIRRGVLVVEETDVPLAVDCSRKDYQDRPLKFVLSTGSVFVPVSAGQEGAFIVGGDMPGDKVGVRICDPNGGVVFEKPSLLYWTRFVAPKSAKDGLWQLTFSKPDKGGMWSYYAEVVGIRPFFFFSKEKYWYSK